MEWVSAFNYLAAAALGALLPYVLAKREKPTRRVADTAAIVDASGHVITTLRAEITRLDRELEETRVEARDLRRHISRLEAQLRTLGETPVNGV